MAQDDIIQVQIGNNYSNQVYYTLENDETTTIGNNTWDIAFAITTSLEAGIHVNESVSISFTGASPSTLLYKAPVNIFEEIVYTDEIGDSLYNDESSWGYGGALNIQKDPANYADFGWGYYNPANHALIGDRVFVIKLRDESYRKFIIESMINGVYTLKYAALDGSNEQTVLIDKAEYENHHLILFSFLDGAVIEGPSSWDLVFQRYSDLDPSNVGIDVEYTVTGILTAPGVLSVQADNVNPDDVNFENYLDSLDSQLDIIGQDWKFYSFDTGWNIIDDRVFFVKTADNKLWQIYMYDFEGSSTGTYTFAKWDLGEVAGVKDAKSNFSSLTVVPNPASSNAEFSLVLESKNSGQARISVIDLDGRLVMEYEKQISTGLNAVNISTSALVAGNYFLAISTPDERIVRKLAIK